MKIIKLAVIFLKKNCKPLYDKLRFWDKKRIVRKIQNKYPIDNQKVFFICHKGKQYSCNPKYISEYMMKNYPDVKIVWAFNKPKDFSNLKQLGIKSVKTESYSCLFEMCTSKVIVTNVDVYPYYKNRNEQVVFDTWHGGGTFKTCGFANPYNLDTEKKKKFYSDLYGHITHYCSSSKMFSNQTIRFSRKFNGEIFEVGMPRNDILFDSDTTNETRNLYYFLLSKHKKGEVIEKIYQYFNLPEYHKKIVLYAPTYRNIEDENDFEQLNTMLLLNSLKQRFGNEFILLYRSHHFKHLKANFDENFSDVVFDVSKYPEMQELLKVSDVLISDYSSCIWDFSLMYKPVFLFAPDVDSYRESRSFYLPIEQWPYILCRSNEELREKVIHFDNESYKKAVNNYFKLTGNCETGRATEIVGDFLYKQLGEKEE